MATCASNGMWLATIPTAADWHNAKLAVPCGGSAWLGGSDERQEGTWVWDDGPDKGIVFYEHGSRRCYSGTCPWAVSQPDNYGYGGQDHLYLAYNNNFDLLWDDLQSPVPGVDRRCTNIKDESTCLLHSIPPARMNITDKSKVIDKEILLESYDYPGYYLYQDTRCIGGMLTLRKPRGTDDLTKMTFKVTNNLKRGDNYIPDDYVSLQFKQNPDMYARHADWYIHGCSRASEGDRTVFQFDSAFRFVAAVAEGRDDKNKVSGLTSLH
eukprot:PhM_4_TR14129/c1_g2_i10/m.90800